MPFTNTLLAIKQNALQSYRSRQYVAGTVASYSTTWMQDLGRQEPIGEFERVDSFIRFTSGAANGSEARVTGWSPGNSSVIFAPSVPSLSASTSYYISKTFANGDMNLAVNETLRDMAPERLVQSFATAAEVDGVQTISVPSAAGNAIAQIVRIDRSWGTTNSLYDYRQLYEGADYAMDIDSGTYTLRLNYPAVSGNLVRFHYRRPAAELSADTDSTDEPMSLVLAGTKKWLALQDGETELIDRYGKEFEAAKRDYLRSQPAKTIKTPRIGVVGYGRRWDR